MLTIFSASFISINDKMNAPTINNDNPPKESLNSYTIDVEKITENNEAE